MQGYKPQFSQESSKAANPTLSRQAKIRENLKVWINCPKAIGLVYQSHKGYTLLLTALIILQGLLPVASVWVTASLIDQIANAIISRSSLGSVNGALISNVFMLLLAYSIITLLSQILSPTVEFIQNELGEWLTREVNLRILEKINKFEDISFFDNPQLSIRLQQAQSEAGTRPINMLTSMVMLLRAIISMLSMLYVLITFQPVLVLVVCSLSLPFILVQFRNQHQNWSLRNTQSQEVQKLNYFKSVLTGGGTAKEVRLFNLGDYFLGRYKQKFDELQINLRNLRVVGWRWKILLSIMSGLSFIISYSYIILKAVNGQISLGSINLYTAAVGQVQTGMNTIVSQLSMLYQGNLFISHLFTFLNMQPTPLANTLCLAKDPLTETHKRVPNLESADLRIVFKNVSFSYPHNGIEVLHNLNLVIEPRQTIALVGENGAGKTTLVKLLTRLYEPTSGSIEVNGVDLREYDLIEWRKAIGVVFQDFAHYQLTMRENIGVGQVEEIENQALIKLAAEFGGVSDIIDGLPNGLETTVGLLYSNRTGPYSEKSTNNRSENVELSGGQWQKIALARAFMRTIKTPNYAGVPELDRNKGSRVNAQILVLDEPTAALDPRAEHELYQHFSELTQAKTTLLITHRFTTVKMADKIVVLKQGSLVEEGSHDELMLRAGEYAQLYNMQANLYYRETETVSLGI